MEKIDYGYFPWYAGRNTKLAALEKLPKQGLVAISSDKRYKIDFRSIGGWPKMYFTSPAACKCFSGLVTNMNEIVPVAFVHRDGSAMKNQEMFIARPDDIPLSAAIDAERSVLHGSEVNLKIERLVMKETLRYDVLTLQGLSSFHDSVFCSNRAKEVFEIGGIRGLTYIPLDEVDWKAMLEEDFMEIAMRQQSGRPIPTPI